MKTLLLASLLFGKLIFAADTPQAFLGDNVEVYTSDEEFLAEMYPKDDRAEKWGNDDDFCDFTDDPLTAEQLELALELRQLEKLESSESEKMSNSDEYNPSFPDDFYSGVDSEGKKLPEGEVRANDVFLQSTEMKALEKKEIEPGTKETPNSLGPKKSVKLITFTLGDEKLSKEELLEKMKRISLENDAAKK